MAIKHNKGIPPYSYEILRGYVFWAVMCSQHSLAYGGATDVFKSMGGKKSYLKTHIASPRRQPPNQQQKQ